MYPRDKEHPGLLFASWSMRRQEKSGCWDRQQFQVSTHHWCPRGHGGWVRTPGCEAAPDQASKHGTNTAVGEVRAGAGKGGGAASRAHEAQGHAHTHRESTHACKPL